MSKSAKQPEKPFKRINVKISPEAHALAKSKAALAGVDLNQWVLDAIKEKSAK